MANDPFSERTKDYAKALTHSDEPYFDEVWPSETRGDGIVRKNNIRTGAAQGKSNLIRKAPCRLCGFLNDMVKVDHSGGSIDGEGAAGNITLATASVPTSAPASINGVSYTHTEPYGTQAYRVNSGCALCYTKNSTLMRVDPSTYLDPHSRITNLGF